MNGLTVRAADVIASRAAPHPDRPRPVRGYARCACGQLYALPKDAGRPPERCSFCAFAALRAPDSP